MIKKISKRLISFFIVFIMITGSCCTALAGVNETYFYPPFSKVEIEAGGSSYLAEAHDSGTEITYDFNVPQNVDLSNATLNITIGTFVDRYIKITVNGIAITRALNTAPEGSPDRVFTWTNLNLGSTQTISAMWPYANGFRGGDYKLIPHKTASNVELTSLSIGGHPVTIEENTVGGVTRYNGKAEMPKGTDLTNLTVAANTKSSTATVTLDGGTNFTGINFATGSHTLRVTDGNLSRDYTLSAYIPNEKITVHLGVRTWTAYDWNQGITTRFDYKANGFKKGGKNDLAINHALLKIDSNVQTDGNGAPIPCIPSIDSGTHRPIFENTKYIDIQVDSGTTAMQAILKYCEEKGFTYDGTGTSSGTNPTITYLSSISDTSGNSLGEFDCDQGSGWMYVVRTSGSDVETPLPMYSAADYTLSNGQYLDWMYTAAYGSDLGYGMF